jgi:hypothetical protein
MPAVNYLPRNLPRPLAAIHTLLGRIVSLDFGGL